MLFILDFSPPFKFPDDLSLFDKMALRVFFPPLPQVFFGAFSSLETLHYTEFRTGVSHLGTSSKEGFGLHLKVASCHVDIIC